MNRDFKGIWIPKEIWLDERLCATEKVVYSEIHSLDDGKGCWAGNKHFSTIVGVKPDRISHILSRLSELGMIRCEIDGKKRHIYVINNVVGGGGTLQITSGPRYLERPYKENNTVDNTTTPSEGVKPRSQEVSLEGQGEEKGRVNWENCKSDMQRLISWYVATYLPELYETALKTQVRAFYGINSKRFAGILNVSGSLDVAKDAIKLFTDHFSKNGWAWNMKTLDSNISDFINLALEKRRAM